MKTKTNAMVHSALLVALSIAGAQVANAAPKMAEMPAGLKPAPAAIASQLNW